MVGVTPSRLTVPCRILQLAFAAMCLGVAWATLRYGDAVSSFLFLDLDWSETAANRVSVAAGWALIASAVALLWRAGWPALVFVAGWSGLLAALTMVQQPPRYWLIPGAHAVRIAAPLALAMLLAAPAPSRRREGQAVTVLEWSVAGTFACHGLQALAHEGVFLDYLFALSRQVGLALDPDGADLLLGVIGAVDLGVAMALLLPFSRVRVAAAIYMAGWGLATAAVRTAHSGPAQMFETLLRIPNGGVPLALVFYYRLRRRGAESRSEA